ncbi:hypothetical protein Peur_010045 [Populus x canadensis]
MIQSPLAPTSVRELGSDTANILGQKQELLILQEFCRQVGKYQYQPECWSLLQEVIFYRPLPCRTL